MVMDLIKQIVPNDYQKAIQKTNFIGNLCKNSI